MKKLMVCLLLSCLIFSNYAFAQDRKADSQKLFLEASSLIRQENYLAAKPLLERILKDYSDMEIAIDADRKLSELTPKLSLASLPKVPGVYVKLKSSELLKFETEPITKCSLAKVGATTLDDLLNAPSVQYILFSIYKKVAADEMESIIIYAPNQPDMPMVNMCYAELVKEGTRTWIDEPQGSKGKNKYILYSEWTDNTTSGGSIKSVEIIKKKLAENIYELKIPEGLVPKYQLFAINDGLGNAYPFILSPSKVAILMEQYINVWNTSDEALTEISNSIKSQPTNPSLYKMLSIINYRRADFDGAIQNASKGLEFIEQSNSDDKQDFQTIINRSKAAKLLKDIKLPTVTTNEGLMALIPAYEDVLKVDPVSHLAKYGLYYIYYNCKDWDKAIQYMEETIKLYENLNNPRNPIHYLDSYKRNEKNAYDDFLDLTKQEKIIKELNDSYLNGNANIEEGINKGKEARKLSKTNPRYYFTMGEIYFKAGKFKDARKQMEEALDCAKKMKVGNLSPYQEKLTIYQEAEKANK